MTFVLIRGKNLVLLNKSLLSKVHRNIKEDFALEIHNFPEVFFLPFKFLFVWLVGF